MTAGIAASLASEPDDVKDMDAHIDWRVIEGSFVTLYVDPEVNLRRAQGRLNVSFAKRDPVERHLFLDKGLDDGERLVNKFDIIYRKAQKILNMYPRNLNVDVKIYANERDMQRHYTDIFKEKQHYKSFYILRYNTIYISYSTLDAHILSHEMGHAISDHYFVIQPPPRIKELLAGYVDLHLED